MRTITATCGLLVVVAVSTTGQQPSQADRPGLYPALQREFSDPELIARGEVLYGINCRGCHGVDLRGGDLGGPNLLRSQLVLSDRQGETMFLVIRDGRSSPGGSTMPPQPLSEDDVRAVAEYMHSVLATADRQGGPPVGDPVELDIVVGDAEAGRAYFSVRCASCHTAAGDLAGVGSRYESPKELQNTWVRGRARNADAPEITVTVTTPAGERVQGRLDRLDDFVVVLTQPDGRHRSFSRHGDVPSVEVADPLAGHIELLPVYGDRDVHDVTAYLVTLR